MNFADPERVEVAVLENRSRFRSFAGLGGGRIHGVRRRVSLLPKHLARLRIDARGDLFCLLPGENEYPAGSENGRRVPFADCDLPLRFEMLGPRGRRSARRENAITVRTAPLRPVFGLSKGG